MRALATLIAAFTMALTALGLAVAAPGGDDDAADIRLMAAAGSVRISNSREGQAVLTAAGLRPGNTVSGTVQVGNAGDVAGRFVVRGADLVDTPGPYGGRMSHWAWLVVADGSRTLYAGPPMDFGEVDLGTLAAGERREYLVSLALPDGDNRYQGSALSLRLVWLAGPVDGGGTPVTPTPVPPQPPTTTKPPTTPAPTTPPAGEPTGDALGDMLGLPSATRCVSRRRFTIRLRAPNGARVVSATITIKGKKPVTVKGRKARAPVNLRGLPKGKIRVRVTVRASNGRTYTHTRMYRTCVPRATKKRRKRS
jgi:hypothetical protein